VTVLYVAVIGGGTPQPDDEVHAEAVGEVLAMGGATLITGGLGGVMAAACRGAKSAGGITVGVLPTDDRSTANEWVDVAVPTGLGEARNALVVRMADSIVAIGGEYGTLSEIGLALRAGKPVIGLGTWTLVRPDGSADTGIVPATDPEGAASLALSLAEASTSTS
jgi:uncharacterized protein (TIGR00725 family)